MSPIKKDLFVEVAESVSSPVNKVTVVGVGQVGMACAFSILAQVSAWRNCEKFNWLFDLIDLIVFSLSGSLHHFHIQ